MGKSTWLSALCVCLIYGYWIFDVPNLALTSDGDYPDRSQIHPKYWVYRPDGVPFANPARILLLSGLPFRQGVGTILWPKIESFLPPALLRDPNFLVQKGQFSVPVRIAHPNGSEVLIGSGMQDTMSFEGMDTDAALNDEPIPRGFWSAIWRGLTDRMGFVVFSMTPWGPNAPWIHDELLPRDDTCFQTGSIWSNPHLTQQAKEEFLAGLHCSEEEYHARETGAFSLMSVRAFPTFDRAVHIVPKREPPAGWKRFLICDPAHRRPFFFVWLAKGPNGEVEIYDEWPRGVDYMHIRSSDKTVRDYCTLIRDSEGRFPADLRLLDPRFGKAEFSVKGFRTTTIQHDFAQHGLFFNCNIPGCEREETGIQLIRDLLAWDKHAPLSELNRPQLTIQEQCQNCITAMERSTFVPPKARDPQLLDEAVTDHYKDPRDCIRYGCLFPAVFNEFASDGYISEAELLKEDDYDIF
jgi:hypothetical protein